MAASNRVILTGRVGRTPERYYRPDGSPVIQFPLEWNDSDEGPGARSQRQALHRDRTAEALHRDGSGQAGKKRINIIVVGKPAEMNLDLLQRGQALRVEGRLNQRNWRTPEGKHRTETEIIATDLRTIDEKNLSTDSNERRKG